MIDVKTLAQKLTSPKTGILKRLLLLPWSANQIPLMHVVGAIPDYGILPNGGAISRPGGSSLYLEDGYAKVLFEAVERYCAAFVDYSELVLSTPNSKAFIWGDELPLFADFQYEQEKWPFQPLGKDSMIYWTRGRSLLTGRNRFFPASLTYVPYKTTSQHEWLGPSTSTGMASGDSWESACLAGLMEVCERDAFTIMWMNRLSMPRLRIDPESDLGREIDRFISPSGAKITFVNMSNDLQVPAVAAVLDHLLNGERLLTVGLSAKPTFEQACRKAMAECVSEYERLRVKLEEPGERWQPTPGFTNVVDFEWHGLTYADPKFHPYLDFMTSSTVEQSIDQPIEFRAEPAQTLNHFLKILETKVQEVIAIKLTTREIEEMGIHVMKVVIPDLVPLNADHNFPWLGHRRLYEVPCQMGLLNEPNQAPTMNPMPHPFS